MTVSVNTNTIEHIYLDMDGVLCDFITKYKEIFDLEETPKKHKTFNTNSTKYDHDRFVHCVRDHNIFKTLEPMPGFEDLMRHIETFLYENSPYPGVSLSILTSMATRDEDLQKEIKRQKSEWLIDHGVFFPVEFVKQSTDKKFKASNTRLLIDDNLVRCITPFAKKGGQVIHHIDAETTMSHLPLYGKFRTTRKQEETINADV